MRRYPDSFQPKPTGLHLALQQALRPSMRMAGSVLLIGMVGAGLPSQAFEISDLNSTNGFVVNGAAGSDSTGTSVSEIGDVNGDGFNDMILTAPSADPNGNASGAAYVVFGRSQPFPAAINLSALNGSDGFVINGPAANDNVGINVRSVSGLGDVNDDNIDDFIIGAQNMDSNGVFNNGASFVIFGASDLGAGGVVELSGLNGSNGLRINGVAQNDRSGRTVSRIGDVNNDNINDLLIGADDADPNGTYSGACYVVFGDSSLGTVNPLSLSSLNGSNGVGLNGFLSPIFSYNDICIRADGVGDINGDNIDDVIIGGPAASPNSSYNSGIGFVVFGDSGIGGTGNFQLSSLNGSNGFRMTGLDSADNLGTAVRGIGDINGDGRADLVISAPGGDPSVTTNNAGELYIVFGSTSLNSTGGNLALNSLNGNNGFKINGLSESSGISSNISAAGDVNADGVDDFIISRGSTSYVLFGSSTIGAGGVFELSALDVNSGFLINSPAGGSAGGDTSGLGDVNNDGIDDFIIGDPAADPFGSSSGAGYIIFGNTAPTVNNTAPLSLTATEEDNANPPGDTVSNLFSARFSDNNSDPFSGIAIIANSASASDGVWQSSPDGNTWSAIATGLSDSNALILSSGDFLRFLPATEFSGTPGSLTVRLWDGKGFSSGSGIDISGGIAGIGGFTNDQLVLNTTVNPVNDQPSLSIDSAVLPAVNEDAAAQTVNNWASFSPGPANESAQTPTYIVTSVSNTALFGAGPAVDTNGNLSFTPAADASGFSTFTVVVQDSGGTANGGIDTSNPKTGFITVQPVNDQPAFSASNPPTVNENAGFQFVPGWSSFAPGGGIDEAGQVPIYTISNISNAALFSILPSVDLSGNLTYQAALDTTGSSTFDVTVQDTGGTANGGQDTSPAQTFTITVNAAGVNVNDPPSFTASNPPVVNEDAGAQTVSGWVTSFSPGPADESGQTALAYTVSNISNPALFSVAPGVDVNGNLTYTAAANANGSSTFDVVVQDDGGTVNGGQDTSAVQTFTLTVNAVNDAPDFTAVDPPSVNLNAGAQIVNNWAMFIAGGGTDETSQTPAYSVSNISNPALFSVAPSVDSSGTLTYTPANDASGDSTFDVSVQDDGGTANGGEDTSATKTFTISIGVLIFRDQFE